jgi:ribosomal protein L29
MKSHKVAELKKLSLQELVEKLEITRQELFKLRLNAATSHVKSFPSQKREHRKAIARMLTIFNQKTNDVK